MEWRALPGYEGFYEITATGQVRSLIQPMTWLSAIEGDFDD